MQSKQEKNYDPKQLKVLHTAMFVGSAVIICVFTFISGEKLATMKFNFEVLTVLGMLLPCLLAFISHTLWLRLSSQISQDQLQIDIDKQRSAAYILRWVFLEAGVLISVVFYYLNFNGVHLYLSLSLWILLYLAKPQR